MEADPADPLSRLRRVEAWIFDMDGVLYRGESPLFGVQPLLTRLSQLGCAYMLATNNSMATADQYVAKLSAMEITTAPDRILTSAVATRDYLEQTLPKGATVFVVGMPALAEQLFTGVSFVPWSDGASNPGAVVVGLDTEFTYDKLKRATAAIRAGARFVATNSDATLPTESGVVPGCGSIVAAIQTASGQAPVVIGKPETLLLEMCLTRLSSTPENAVMIGDRLDTDILAGNRAGMLTVLVLTGVSHRDDIASSPTTPDIVVEDLTELTALLTGVVPPRV